MHFDNRATGGPALIGPEALYNLKAQIADLLAQRIPVQAEQMGGPDLVAARGAEADRQQRPLDFLQDPVIEAGRRKPVALCREIGREMALDRCA